MHTHSSTPSLTYRFIHTQATLSSLSLPQAFIPSIPSPFHGTPCPLSFNIWIKLLLHLFPIFIAVVIVVACVSLFLICSTQDCFCIIIIPLNSYSIIMMHISVFWMHFIWVSECIKCSNCIHSLNSPSPIIPRAFCDGTRSPAPEMHEILFYLISRAYPSWVRACVLRWSAVEINPVASARGIQWDSASSWAQ
jgi:hypothetical protein